MYFQNKIKELVMEKSSTIFVDMDGVITDYDLLGPLDFKNKRPLITNIKTLEDISKIKDVTLYTLSICKKDYQIREKNDWLDKHAPFFKKENRIIISKESNPDISSKRLKEIYLKQYLSELDGKLIIVIDDDNEILRHLKNKFNEIIFFQDSSLVD